jgi:hypothetical protein
MLELATLELATIELTIYNTNFPCWAKSIST